MVTGNRLNLESCRPLVLGSILVSVGGIIWLLTCYMIIRHSPAKKSLFWKVKECLILALGISNFWMESQLFVLYTGGEGLVYKPMNEITVALGFLPVVAVTIFTLRCYIAVRYRRVWDINSYYKDRIIL